MVLVERDFNFDMDFLYDVVKAYDSYEKEHKKTYTSVFDTCSQSSDIIIPIDITTMSFILV